VARIRESSDKPNVKTSDSVDESDDIQKMEGPIPLNAFRAALTFENCEHRTRSLTQRVTTDEYVAYGWQALHGKNKEERVVNGFSGISDHARLRSFRLQHQCGFEGAHCLSGAGRNFIGCLNGKRGKVTPKICSLSKKGHYMGLVPTENSSPPWRLTNAEIQKIQCYLRCINFPSSTASEFNVTKFLSESSNLKMDDIFKVWMVVMEFSVNLSDLPSPYKALYTLISILYTSTLTLIVDTNVTPLLHRQVKEALCLSEGMLPSKEAIFLKHEWEHIVHDLPVMGPLISNNALVYERGYSNVKRWVPDGGRNSGLTIMVGYQEFEHVKDEEERKNNLKFCKTRENEDADATAVPNSKNVTNSTSNFSAINSHDQRNSSSTTSTGNSHQMDVSNNSTTSSSSSSAAAAAATATVSPPGQQSNDIDPSILRLYPTRLLPPRKTSGPEVVKFNQSDSLQLLVTILLYEIESNGLSNLINLSPLCRLWHLHFSLFTLQMYVDSSTSCIPFLDMESNPNGASFSDWFINTVDSLFPFTNDHNRSLNNSYFLKWKNNVSKLICRLESGSHNDNIIRSLNFLNSYILGDDDVISPYFISDFGKCLMIVQELTSQCHAIHRDALVFGMHLQASGRVETLNKKAFQEGWHKRNSLNSWCRCHFRQFRGMHLGNYEFRDLDEFAMSECFFPFEVYSSKVQNDDYDIFGLPKSLQKRYNVVLACTFSTIPQNQYGNLRRINFTQQTPVQPRRFLLLTDLESCKVATIAYDHNEKPICLKHKSSADDPFISPRSNNEHHKTKKCHIIDLLPLHPNRLVIRRALEESGLLYDFMK
jgi:hypothetical protein